MVLVFVVVLTGRTHTLPNGCETETKRWVWIVLLFNKGAAMCQRVIAVNLFWPKHRNVLAPFENTCHAEAKCFACHVLSNWVRHHVHTIIIFIYRTLRQPIECLFWFACVLFYYKFTIIRYYKFVSFFYATCGQFYATWPRTIRSIDCSVEMKFDRFS